MAIEFYCPSCEALLRTPDAQAGINSHCPSCHDPVVIPVPGELIREPVSARPSGPKKLNHAEDEPLVPDGDFLPVSVDIGTILNTTWNVYRANFAICLWATVVDLAYSVVVLIVVLIPVALNLRAVQGNLALPASVALLILGYVTAMASLTVGNYRYFLALTRGEEEPLRKLFQMDRAVGRLAVAGGLFWVLVVMGVMSCILPGLLVFIFLWPYGRLIVDQDLSAGEALPAAFRLTREYAGTSTAVSAIHFLILIGSGGIPVIGPVLALPFGAILHSVAYLHMTGEFVTGEAPASNL